MSLPAMVLYAPHLGRDLRHIMSKVPDVQVVTGEQTPRGEDGCLQGHKRAIRMAIERGWSSVLILEDDCLFTPAFDLPKWEETCRAAVRAGFTTVFGGSVRTEGARLHWPASPEKYGLVACRKLCSAHCVFHHHSGYDAVLAAEQPYDLQLGDCGAVCAVTLPFVAIQRAGLSGIGLPLDAGDSKRYAGPQVVNYEGLFQMHEQGLIAAFRAGGV